MLNLPNPDTQPQFYEGVPVKRALAWLVDMILIVVLCVVIVPFTAFTGLFFFPLLVLLVGFAYRVITLSGGSATWGMWLMGIELRRADGSRFDPGTAVLHTLGFSVSMAFPVLQVISAVLMATDSHGRGLSDMVLGTTALNRRSQIA